MLTVAEIMRESVDTISSSACVADAISQMQQQQQTCLVVAGPQQNFPYGIVTAQDVVCKVIARGHNPARVLVQDIMHQPCLAIQPHMSVQAVAQHLADKGIQQVPVMSDSQLLGVVSIADILMTAELPVLASS